MSLFVDTSVWSLALRRDGQKDDSRVVELRRALTSGEPILTTGLVLQELLQGFSGPRLRDQIIDRFSALAFLVPGRDDHIEAADLRNGCRRKGLQVSTIDALLATLCIRNDLAMLSADKDFAAIASRYPLTLWPAG
ncbi:MAG TPA: PIN domain-containing protein [Caulobacteraceae bacterium]|nr:PIN domain-containing protein [Caulobacteraceae bacterium]